MKEINDLIRTLESKRGGIDRLIAVLQDFTQYGAVAEAPECVPAPPVRKARAKKATKKRLVRTKAPQVEGTKNESHALLREIVTKLSEGNDKKAADFYDIWKELSESHKLSFSRQKLSLLLRHTDGLRRSGKGMWKIDHRVKS